MVIRHPSGLYLPDGYDAHRRVLSTEETSVLRPHSIRVSKQSIEGLGYQNGTWTGHDTQGQTVQLESPVVISLDGILSTVDGDHRCVKAVGESGGVLPVICYDLASPTDLEAISVWKHEVFFVLPHLNAPRASHRQGFTREMMDRFYPAPRGEEVLEFYREERAFVAAEGFNNHHDLYRGGGLVVTKEEAENTQQRRREEWNRDQR